MDTKELWNIEKFDIIIGNPPYTKKFLKIIMVEWAEVHYGQNLLINL